MEAVLDIFIFLILMTGSDYSQEVNKMNEHIFIDHSITTQHVSELLCGLQGYK